MVRPSSFLPWTYRGGLVLLLTHVSVCNKGSWSQPLEPGISPASPTMLNSNKQDTREEIKYSKKDIEHIEKWGAYLPPSHLTFQIASKQQLTD